MTERHVRPEHGQTIVQPVEKKGYGSGERPVSQLPPPLDAGPAGGEAPPAEPAPKE